MGATAALVGYNTFANPHFFNYMRAPAPFWLIALTLYATMYHDKAAIGGIAGGYAAFLLI